MSLGTAHDALRAINQAAAQGDGDAMLRLAAELCASPRDDAAQAPLKRLLSLTRANFPDLVVDVSRLFVEAGVGFEAPYNLYLADLERRALSEPGLRAFLANRASARRLLLTALATLPDETIAHRMFDLRLARTLHQLGDDAGTGRLVARLAPKSGMAIYGAEIAKLSALFLQTEHHAAIRACLDSALAIAPENQDVWLADLRWRLKERLVSSADEQRIMQMHREKPDDPTLRRLAAATAFLGNDCRFAADAYTVLAHSTDDLLTWDRAGLSALRAGDDERARMLFGKARPRFRSSNDPLLNELLLPIADALNREHPREARTDPNAMAQRLTVARDTLERWLRTAAASSVTSSALMQAASRLMALEDAPFGLLAHIEMMYPAIVPFDRRYSDLDLGAYRLAWVALLEHAAVLSARVLTRLLDGHPAESLTMLRDAAELYVRAMLELDRPHVAVELLEALRESDCVGELFQRLWDRCRLQQGDVAAVRERLHALTVESREMQEVHPLAEWEGWLRGETLRASTRYVEEAREGRFECANADGTVESFAHPIVGFKLESVAVENLRVRGSEIVIGPAGFILRPSRWHCPRLYPPWNFLTKYVADRGVVLKAPQDVRVIREPIYVLANNNTSSVANYFHWVNYVLSRVAFLRRTGALDEAPVLMPSEAMPWMKDALAMLGVADEHVIWYSRDETLVLERADLISTFDYPGAQYMRQFRDDLWRAAGVSPNAAPDANGPFYFLARPADAKRPVFDLDEIFATVKETGFEPLEPGQLSFAEQVRLFSTASGVAGFSGAAFTNLAFCRDGIRVLELNKRDTMWPDFIGISLALGHEYRYCPGWTDESCLGTKVIGWAPTRFDLSMLARELRWVRRLQG